MEILTALNIANFIFETYGGQTSGDWHAFPPQLLK
jgi:hypothetical protein